MFRGILLMMTGDQQIDYEQLAQDALRSIVRRVLMQVAKSGLPGQHHFYISFNTGAPGVIVSPRLKERYPDEMTIVMQHRFWDLLVSDERFEVKLTFDAIPERLVVPFNAVKVFFDPSVPYGLQFEGSDLSADTTQDLEAEAGEVFTSAPPADSRPAQAEGPVTLPTTAKAEKKPRPPRKRAPKDAPAGEAKGRGVAALGGEETGDQAKVGKTKQGAKPEQPEVEPDNDAKVVHLDRFRKK